MVLGSAEEQGGELPAVRSALCGALAVEVGPAFINQSQIHSSSALSLPLSPPPPQ